MVEIIGLLTRGPQRDEIAYEIRIHARFRDSLQIQKLRGFRDSLKIQQEIRR